MGIGNTVRRGCAVVAFLAMGLTPIMAMKSIGPIVDSDAALCAFIVPSERYEELCDLRVRLETMQAELTSMLKTSVKKRYGKEGDGLLSSDEVECAPWDAGPNRPRGTVCY